MTSEFGLRLIGMIVVAVLGARLGTAIAVPPFGPEVFALAFGLVGSITGLIIAPYFTTRPARYVRRVVTNMPAETLITAIIGLVVGLIIGALFAVPLALLPQPLSQWIPAIIAVIAAYISVTLFAARASDISHFFSNMFHPALSEEERASLAPEAQILLDTSVIIDGRVLDISKTGFLPGTMLVPRFVLIELQRIADSSDVLKRTRGRRGLEILDGLQKESRVPVKIIDSDIEGVRAVDDKLVLLAQQLHAQLMTNDFNLNGVAKLQGISVLNVNELANAVKAVYLPNEEMTIHIIQEGREQNQGVGYLVDGTMVVVEEGKPFIDRTIGVTVTRMIQTAAGKMYFARPVNPL